MSVSSISFNLFIIKDERGNLNVKLKNYDNLPRVQTCDHVT